MAQRWQHTMATHRRQPHMDLLWIIIIVLVVLALLGYFGRGRFR